MLLHWHHTSEVQIKRLCAHCWWDHAYLGGIWAVWWSGGEVVSYPVDTDGICIPAESWRIENTYGVRLFTSSTTLQENERVT